MATRTSASIPNPLSEQNTSALAKVWQSITADSCPHAYNFHMHTLYSDGKLEPEKLMEQVCRIGLKGMAITDHHGIKGYQIAKSWLNQVEQKQVYDSLPHLWTGVEITSELLGTEVHILGYGFDPQDAQLRRNYFQGSAPSGKSKLAKKVISALHKAGGLAVLAHPFRYQVGGKELIPAAADLGIDGVETYYAYRSTNPWQSSPQQTADTELLTEQYSLLRTCGTDTHGYNLMLRI
ncbi:MAG: PHP domain-containing protein [Spirulinaceae cyanobacterium]